MSEPVRIGAVSYINALPLTSGLEPMPNIRYEVPSQLAAALRAGELDVALVPAFEYFSGTRYTIIPEICISSNGPVLSVLLFCKADPHEIKKVAVDAHSLSSVALLKVLAAKRLQIQPTFRSINVARTGVDELFNTGMDAVLMIGDPALQQDKSRHRIIDLGEVWTNLTGRPFVYALWLAREGIDLDAATALLTEAKARGLSRIDAIAADAAEQSDLAPEQIRDYLTQTIQYDLGRKEVDGLNTFKQYCLELELITHDEEIRIHGQ